jgi:hypothetical protein
MVQTNDDLLYVNPDPANKPKFARGNYLYVKDHLKFYCAPMGDIVDTPTLITQLGFPSVSIVVLSRDRLKVYLPPTHTASVVDRSAYLCHKVTGGTKAKYSTNHGDNRLVYYEAINYPFLLSKDEFDQLFNSPIE